MSAHAERLSLRGTLRRLSQAGRTPHLGRGGRGGAGRPRRRDGARRRAAGARRPLGAAARRRSAVRRRRARRAGWRGPPHRARAARAGGRGAPRRDRDRGCRGCCHRRRLSDRRTADAPPRAACPVPGQCAHAAHRHRMGDVHIRHVGAAEAGGPQPRRADRRDQAGRRGRSPAALGHLLRHPPLRRPADPAARPPGRRLAGDHRAGRADAGVPDAAGAARRHPPHRHAVALAPRADDARGEGPRAEPTCGSPARSPTRRCSTR